MVSYVGRCFFTSQYWRQTLVTLRRSNRPDSCRAPVVSSASNEFVTCLSERCVKTQAHVLYTHFCHQPLRRAGLHLSDEVSSSLAFALVCHVVCFDSGKENSGNTHRGNSPDSSLDEVRPVRSSGHMSPRTDHTSPNTTLPGHSLQ